MRTWDDDLTGGDSPAPVTGGSTADGVAPNTGDAPDIDPAPPQTGTTPAPTAEAATGRRAAWARERERRWDRRRDRRGGRSAPVGIVLVPVALIQILGTRLAMHAQPDATALDPLGYWLLAIGPLALLVRRRWPLVSLAVALATTIAYLCLDYPRGPFFLAAFVALSGALRRGNRIVARTMYGLAYLAYVFFGSGQYFMVAVWMTLALALAEAGRVRGQHMAQVASTRAAAQQARQEQSRRQASDERLRIARELHDVLGHHLSLINVRAGVGLHLLDTDPEQAREALGAIKLASSEALREVRGVLAALNNDTRAPRSPAPTLADLDALADEARAAGLTVTIGRTDPQPLPPEVDRAAYRIVQEALTNVRRHAGPAARATVTIRYAADALSVRVDDTGPGPTASTSDGNGLPGMRERASALGGTLTATRNPAGGFRIDAKLPLTQENS